MLQVDPHFVGGGKLNRFPIFNSWQRSNVKTEECWIDYKPLAVTQSNQLWDEFSFWIVLFLPTFDLNEHERAVEGMQVHWVVQTKKSIMYRRLHSNEFFMITFFVFLSLISNDIVINNTCVVNYTDTFDITTFLYWHLSSLKNLLVSWNSLQFS